MKLLVFFSFVLLISSGNLHPLPDQEHTHGEDENVGDDEVADGVVEVPLPEEGVELGDVVNKMDVNAEIEGRFGDFKENCFPKPSGGCRCQVSGEEGDETTEAFDAPSDCRIELNPSSGEDMHQHNDDEEDKRKKRDEGDGEEVEDGIVEVPLPEGGVELGDVVNKMGVNEEIDDRFGDFKDNCFPKPSGGCRCTVNEDGEETTETFTEESDCKLELGSASQEYGNDEDDTDSHDHSEEKRDLVKRQISEKKAKAQEDKARQNYGRVIQELKEKFKGLKEGCYPRPKGCLCVIGKDANGRDITERRKKEADCRCQEGESGPECPAGGA